MCFTCKRDSSHFLHYLKNPSIIMPLDIFLVLLKIVNKYDSKKSNLDNNLFKCRHTTYCIYHKYSDIQACANSVDPDETPQNAASHHSLQYLPLIFRHNNR